MIRNSYISLDIIKFNMEPNCLKLYLGKFLLQSLYKCHKFPC